MFFKIRVKTNLSDKYRNYFTALIKYAFAFYYDHIFVQGGNKKFETSLTSAKLYYIDPRIVVAW